MSRYDYDLFVIGGGSGGVRAARIAAKHGARVAIAEASRYGGTCVIRGCVPKKLFVYAAEYGRHISDAAGYGWSCSQVSFDWNTLRHNKDQEITRLSSLYERNLASVGAHVLHGRASFLGPHTLDVSGRPITAERVLVATGGRAKLLDIPGGHLAITSDHVFDLPQLPDRVCIAGGGYIGVEFAHILAGLGVRVSLVHHRDLALRGFDEDLRAAVTQGLANHGIELYLEDEIAAVEERESVTNRLHVRLRSGARLDTDAVLNATGRVPNTAGIGLEECGVALGEDGRVLVDGRLQSTVDHIYAVGDCTHRYALTPIAIRQGQMFADSVFGGAPARIEYQNIPTAIFAQPPAATVGMSEEKACQVFERVDIYRSSFRPLVHSLSGREQRTMMKLVVDAASQKVVGVHMVGTDAPEIVQCMAVAVRLGATKADLDATVALHPTAAEEFFLMKDKVTRANAAS